MSLMLQFFLVFMVGVPLLAIAASLLLLAVLSLDGDSKITAREIEKLIADTKAGYVVWQVDERSDLYAKQGWSCFDGDGHSWQFQLDTAEHGTELSVKAPKHPTRFFRPYAEPTVLAYRRSQLVDDLAAAVTDRLMEGEQC